MHAFALADPATREDPAPSAGDPPAAAEREQARLHYAALAGWLAGFAPSRDDAPRGEKTDERSEAHAAGSRPA